MDPFDSSGTAEYRYGTSLTNNLYYVVFSVGPDGTADITGLIADGSFLAGPGDDIYVSNGPEGNSF
jgi:hypothetical protein